MSICAPDALPDVMEGLSYNWNGYDLKDPRPEQILNEADDIYDEADFTDWREDITLLDGYGPAAGTCFPIYEAAERLYRLAAIGGNLRALKENIYEIEYYYESDFTDTVWEAIAKAVTDAEKTAAALQSCGKSQEAIRWWKKSASGGNPSGMRGLISCLEMYNEVPDCQRQLSYWRTRLELCT